MKTDIRKFTRYAIAVAGTIFALILTFNLLLYGQETGTRSMVERLEKIAQSVDPRANPYVNPERVKHLRELVEKSDKSEPILTPEGHIQGPQVRLTLATELLFAGQTEEALQQFRYVHASSTGDLLRNPGFRRELQALQAVAYLRLGEQENCILQHNIDACLFPIRDAGIHQIERGSRAAIKAYRMILHENPGI